MLLNVAACWELYGVYCLLMYGVARCLLLLSVAVEKFPLAGCRCCMLLLVLFIGLCSVQY